MNKLILKTGVQQFIEKNFDADIMSVLLKEPFFEGVSQKELAEQLQAKKKCAQKLPTWFNTKNIYYPNKLNIEQTSSEKTAAYKAGLVSGKSLVDVTGGLGVDAYFFSKKIDRVFHCELDGQLSAIAAYNFDTLGAKNIDCVAGDGLNFLLDSKKKVDWVFIDPSRRSGSKGKVFRFKDSEPNVAEHLNIIFEKTSNVLIKASPLFDISKGIDELKFVKEVHVVASSNEVKELLFLLEKGYRSSVYVNTINLLENGHQRHNFMLEEEKAARVAYGPPEEYLYEPNAAILKSGGFKSIGKAFGLKKLHEHSHLYTADRPIDFPGRRFKVLNVIPYNKRDIKKLSIAKANITIRNFSESVASLRKKFKIKDGGDDYLFFTTDMTGKSIVIACIKA